MRIIIAGAGEVGYHLVLNLNKANIDIDIVALDSNIEVLGRLKKNGNIETCLGSCTDENILKQVKIKEADLFLAITDSDETNILSCKMAKVLGAKKTICRIREIHFTDGVTQKQSLDNLGIDWVINPTEILSDEIYRLISAPNTVESRSFFKEKILVIGFNIYNNCSFINSSLGNINQELCHKDIKIIALQKNKLTTLVSNETITEEGDILYFICPTNQLDFLRKQLGYYKSTGNSPIFINGGGNIGLSLAKKIEKTKKNVRIIENNLQRSYQISGILDRTIVLNFDGTNYKNLYNEGVTKASYFISVTDLSEVNITACLLAHELDVEKTICLVKQPEYLSIIDKQTPILTAISPRLVIATYLTQFIFGNDISSYFCLRDSKLEVLQISVNQYSPLIGKSIHDEMLNGSTIGIVKRKNNFILPNSNYSFQANDDILLITHRVDREKTCELVTSNLSHPAHS